MRPLHKILGAFRVIDPRQFDDDAIIPDLLHDRLGHAALCGHEVRPIRPP
jgi:hypothetical protein